MKMCNGFTILEVIIVVLIIGIIAAIAFPAYKDYTKKYFYPNGQPKPIAVINEELIARNMPPKNSVVESTIVYGTIAPQSDEVRCIGGYKFTQAGIQIISSTNGGVPCL